ncbi:hypothetical protein BDP55DRAFT_728951 [Colletotrichum godetiae]|uniref:Lincomycin-condensing protein lmbA n=1 Tax=Colletotrichum godetiae TaxID=1209918 RepID=A0AAJ0AMJ5_9PEZI|nr:uncharacterized protein BDP55DRAFT_728951 [Colletotrichum godetiae]KAK1675163.1 hypothetical protein BDP55DRAFT_728951 [Colletotrichum godetiae]
MECDKKDSCGLLARCLPQFQSSPKAATSDKHTSIIKDQPLRSAQNAASEFINILRTAEKGGKYLERRLRNIVTVNSWTEELAKYILSGVEGLVRHRDTIGQVVRETVDKSAEAAESVFEFAKEHPVFMTIIAIGVLVIIAPWVIEALGFGELGPIADTFASWWQARYAGYVPKGSLFSFFQRLGMTWK